MRRRVVPLLAALLLAAALAPLGAQTTYTNRGAFTAALTSSTTLDFSGIAAPGDAQWVGGSFAPFDYGGLTFGAPGDFTDFYVVDGAYAGGASNIGGGASFELADYGFGAPIANTITFSRVGGFQAFGFDYLFGAIGERAFSVFLDGVQLPPPSHVFGSAGPGFWGVVAAAPVNEVTFTFATDVVVLDNVTYGSARVVPEPGTVALVATGLAGLGLAVRRRRRAG